MIFCGIGTGIIYYPSTTNAYEWFKNHNGIIMGIMETMISFGSFFFSFIGEKIINKQEKKSNDENNLYDFEIGKKIKDYLMILIICLVSTFILSFF
jgi:MFS family permease